MTSKCTLTTTKRNKKTECQISCIEHETPTEWRPKLGPSNKNSSFSENKLDFDGGKLGLQLFGAISETHIESSKTRLISPAI